MGHKDHIQNALPCFIHPMYFAFCFIVHTYAHPIWMMEPLSGTYTILSQLKIVEYAIGFTVSQSHQGSSRIIGWNFLAIKKQMLVGKWCRGGWASVVLVHRTCHRLYTNMDSFSISPALITFHQQTCIIHGIRTFIVHCNKRWYKVTILLVFV